MRKSRPLAKGAMGPMEGLSVPVLVLAMDGSTLHVNKGARAMLGLDADHPADTVMVTVGDDILTAVTAGGDPPERARVMVGPNRDGQSITIDAVLTRWERDATTGPMLLIESTRDAEAYREIQRLTEQLVALSFGYPDMRFEVTRDGRVLDFAVSDPAGLNIPPERLLEPTIQGALPEPAGALLAAAVAGVVDDGAAPIRFALDGPAGEQHFEARLVALGVDERVIITVRNVTDRVMAERDAALTRDRLVDALESISQAFVLYDPDDRLVMANSRYIELFGGDDAIVKPGIPFTDVLRHSAVHGAYGVRPEELEAWMDMRLRLHREGGAPIEARLADGRWLQVEERVTRSGDRVGLRTDITELKRREAELNVARDAADEANQQKTAFVHHLSHELRTPLNAVLGFAQMIADELLGPIGNTRYPVYAKQIAEAGGYMLELINNLLDLAKIEAGRLRLCEEPCDLTTLVDLTVSMIRDRATKANVALLDEVPRDIPKIYGDTSLIRQMLTNLVSNAIKFCPGDGLGRVEIGARLSPRREMTIYVRDNGRGMSPEQIPLALSPFQQVHDRTPEVGTGLGLPLTRALIELHGGRFQIESAVGVGTTVHLTFPPERVGIENFNV